MNLRVSSSFIQTTQLLVFLLILGTGLVFIYFSGFGHETKLILAASLVAFLFFISTLFLWYKRNDFSDVNIADMQEDQALFAELYQNSPVPYLRTEKKGEIIDVNAAAVRLYGETAERLVGKNAFSSIFAEGEQQAHVERIQQLVSNGTFVNAQEAQLKRADGKIRWVMISAFPYAHNSEILLTIVDITKQKNIDTAKTEFVSLASHQLRTPLSAIKWNLELLGSPKMGELNDKQKMYVEKLSRNAERMTLLIKDFLDASQLEMGTFSTTISNVPLTDFIEQQLEEFEARITNKKLTIQKNFPQNETTIETDSHLLRMSVSNLISNAVKYTPDEGTVIVGYTESAGSVTISVRDTGYGIPVSDQEKLFSKFYRASNVKTTTIEGTGIGLYIVKQAIEMMKGTIAYRTQEKVGTEFVITLPIHH